MYSYGIYDIYLYIAWEDATVCLEMKNRDCGPVGFPDENGDLGRIVPSGQVLVPGDVRLDGDSISWRLGHTARYREVSPHMLNEFVELQSRESILCFAKKWGVLGMSGDTVLRPGCLEMRDGRWTKQGKEPIAAWQYYSRRAHAVLSVVGALNQNKLGDLSDWDEFAKLFLHRTEKEANESVDWVRASLDHHRFGLNINLLAMCYSHEEQLARAREFIAREIADWLDCWKVEKSEALSDFGLIWNDGLQKWDLQIDYHGLLFPAIALQLALGVADVDSLYTCSGCGLPYIRPRNRKRPKAGWANYCDRCDRQGVGKRRAVEAYREKKAEAMRLHRSGVSQEEIADKVDADLTRVRGWIEKGVSSVQTKTRK
jgi:hypothetical protein